MCGSVMRLVASCGNINVGTVIARGEDAAMDVQQILREIGEWTGDASVGRGAVTVAGGVTAIVFAAWRWLRGAPKKRSSIRIDCEPGEKITVRLGDSADEERV